MTYITPIYGNALSALDDDALMLALDDALEKNEISFVWQIVAEIERRGDLLSI